MRSMKKQLLIVGITILLIAVGLSGCTQKNFESEGENLIAWETQIDTLSVFHNDDYEGNFLLGSEPFTNLSNQMNNYLIYEGYDDKIELPESIGTYFDFNNQTINITLFYGNYSDCILLPNEEASEAVTYYFQNMTEQIQLIFIKRLDKYKFDDHIKTFDFRSRVIVHIENEEHVWDSVLTDRPYNQERGVVGWYQDVLRWQEYKPKDDEPTEIVIPYKVTAEFEDGKLVITMWINDLYELEKLPPDEHKARLCAMIEEAMKKLDQ